MTRALRRELWWGARSQGPCPGPATSNCDLAEDDTPQVPQSPHPVRAEAGSSPCRRDHAGPHSPGCSWAGRTRSHAESPSARPPRQRRPSTRSSWSEGPRLLSTAGVSPEPSAHVPVWHQDTSSNLEPHLHTGPRCPDPQCPRRRRRSLGRRGQQDTRHSELTLADRIVGRQRPCLPLPGNLHLPEMTDTEMETSSVLPAADLG